MLETKYRKVNELQLLDINPRFIRDNDFKKLCDSLKANTDYFEARPLILSNRTGQLVVIAGNMRLRAANELGLKEVPTVLLPNLTEEREKEIVIRDNVSNGEWDYDTLSTSFTDVPLGEWMDLPIGWGEEEELEEENTAPMFGAPTLKIEFETELEMKEARTQIEELLRGKMEIKIK